MKLGRPFTKDALKKVRSVRITDSELKLIKIKFKSLQKFIDAMIDKIKTPE